MSAFTIAIDTIFGTLHDGMLKVSNSKGRSESNTAFCVLERPEPKL